MQPSQTTQSSIKTSVTEYTTVIMPNGQLMSLSERIVISAQHSEQISISAINNLTNRSPSAIPWFLKDSEGYGSHSFHSGNNTLT